VDWEDDAVAAGLESAGDDDVPADDGEPAAE
jgi:hypothetical protein